MNVTFKFRRDLVDQAKTDLSRRHAFAHERVGFITAGVAAAGADLVILAKAYLAVADEDYINAPGVGAMMGPNAIRLAMQQALNSSQGVFHIHMHGGGGIPQFSGIDVRENAKFVPDFFKTGPKFVHGALVLTRDGARGQIWMSRTDGPHPVDQFVEVGTSIRKWRPS